MKIDSNEMLAWLRNVEANTQGQITSICGFVPEKQNEGRFAGIITSAGGEWSTICAQARWILYGDHEAAKAHLAVFPTFAVDVIDAIRCMPDAMAGKRVWDGFKLEYFLLNPLMVGLLLAGARSEFTQLCEAISTNADAFVPRSRKHIVGEFVAQLADVGADITDRIRLEAFEKAQMFKPSHFVFGYHEMLFHLARGDMTEFERVRAEREAAFPGRSRSRLAVDQFDIWGHGKVAQSACFDALGTALCRLAVWRGLPVNVNTRLYPREFYAE